MTDPIRPRKCQFSDLVLSVGLILLLIASAAYFGRISLSFGLEVYEAIANQGVDNGLQMLARQIQNSVIRDFTTVVADTRDSIDLGLILTLLTAVAAPALFAMLWLRLAQQAMTAFMSGVWALSPRDDEEDGPGAMPDLREVNQLLLAEDFQAARLSQEDRAMLGRSARYTPRTFIALQRKLRLPARQVLTPFLNGIFWVVLAAGVLACVASLAINDADVLWLALSQVAASFTRAFGLPATLLAAALLGLGFFATMIDLRFARALAPRKKPSTNKSTEMLRELTANSTPEQFLSVLKSELAIRLKQARITTDGNDGQRQGFVDQSSFHLDILIEAASEKSSNPSERAATRRLWMGVTLTVLGAALPLLFLFPPAVVQLLKMDSFSLLGSTSALVWMMLALSAGRSYRNLGQRLMADSEMVLTSEWLRSPIAVLRLDGTVNTQTAMMGKAQDDSFGAENRIQQLRFDARLISCTMSTVSPKPEEIREIVAFEDDTAAQSLHHAVSELVREEGSKSTFSAVGTTIQDNQIILEQVEMRKAERKLQLAQLQAQVKQLEKEAGDDDSDQPILST